MCRMPSSLLVLGGIFATGLLGVATPASAQLQISGQADLIAKAGTDRLGLNRNFRGDGSFNEMRVRLFARRWITEHIGVFAEFLFDIDAQPRLQGAYLVLNELGDLEWLNARIGLAPPLIGNFGLRSTYFNTNPLTGVPMVWQHRTTLDLEGTASNEDLVARKASNQRALPMLYETCWNIQWEILGEIGRFEYSLGVTPGSLSNPLTSRGDDGIQVLARVGIEPTLGFRIGASAAVGPYIGRAQSARDTPSSFPGSPTDYVQRLVGYDFEYSRGKVRIFSEAYWNSWEAPLVTELLKMWGGYAEARYDIAPGLFASARYGRLWFGDISATSDGLGERVKWDDEVWRWEAALGYRLIREILVKLDWQHTEFVTGGNAALNLLALQLSAVF
ncbi:MAG: hypothetical protein IIC36_12880 [Gemmatimonadetes bacterium]|nr:hypothetical protein [Gemmatimonadota bacterium]